MNKWLVIPIEVMHRELQARLIISSVAVQRGYKVLVGQDRVIRRLARHLPKGILFDKSIGRKGDRKVELFSRHKFQITAMDEEVTGYLANPDHFTSVRMANETLAVTQRWFCPAEAVRQDLISRFPGHETKFATTGLARVDLWRQQFQPLFQEEVSRLQDKHGDFLLFNSNFAAIIHARGEAFQIRQRQKQENVHKTIMQEFETQTRQQWQNLDAFSAMLPKLADWFPKHKLVIRPHPSDDIGYWHNIAADHPNCEVVFEGSVTPWILASKCMVHHGCTTGIEAEFLGKPHVMYAPFRDDDHDTEEMMQFAPVVNTENELQSAIRKILKNGFSPTATKSVKKKYYDFDANRLTAEKLIDEFEKIPQTPGNFPKYLSWMKFTPRQLVADHMPRPKRASAYSRQKWPGITVTELAMAVNKIDRILGQQTPCRVTRVFPSLFLIEG